MIHGNFRIPNPNSFDLVPLPAYENYKPNECKNTHINRFTNLSDSRFSPPSGYGFQTKLM